MKKFPLSTWLFLGAAISSIFALIFIYFVYVPIQGDVLPKTNGNHLPQTTGTLSTNAELQRIESLVLENKLEQARTSIDALFQKNPKDPEILSTYLHVLENQGSYAFMKKIASLLLEQNGTTPIYLVTSFRGMLMSASTKDEIRPVFDEFAPILKTKIGSSDEGLFLLCVQHTYTKNTAGIATTCEKIQTSANKEIARFAKTIVDQKKLFETFQDESEDYLDALFAKTFAEHGFLTLAKYKLEYIYNKNPKNADIEGLLGMTYYLLHNIPDAKKLLLSSYQKDPKQPHIIYLLGKIFDAEGRIDDAMSYYYLSLSLPFEKSTEIRKRLATLLVAEKKYELALEQYTALLETKPPVEPETFIAPMYISIELMKKPLESIVLAKKVRALWPDHHVSINLLGWAYLANKQYDTALEYFTLATEKEPSYQPAYYNMGQALEGLNKKDEAQKAYEKSMNLDITSDIGKKSKERYTALSL